jgi:ribosomal protein S18 acetylase RimI-like enzyme
MQKINRIYQYNPTDINNSSVNLRTSAIHMWPAKKHYVFDGWILRFLNPYTYRCNCIYPLKKGYMKTTTKIQKCASIYQQKGAKFLFQIMPNDSKLDILLQALGYKKSIQTRWMALKLDHQTINRRIHKNNILVSKDWLKNRHEIAGYSQIEASIYESFYRAINVQTYPMVLFIDQHPVSCGLGIQVSQYLGIFDIRTKMEFQRQGYASILVQSICKHASQNGARHAQLHVAMDNHAAIYLYEKIGFQTICDYWFREKTNVTKRSHCSYPTFNQHET